jgi:hypothetical protein
MLAASRAVAAARTDLRVIFIGTSPDIFILVKKDSAVSELFGKISKSQAM